MKVTETRKERQRMERERLIIEIAARLLSRDGFQDLNLDELAEAIEYSKGTLYLHFQTKEDLVLAVATQALKLRTALLERSDAWAGSTRDRARAMGFACCEFATAHPDFFKVELMLQARSFWDRVSRERQAEHVAEARRIGDILQRLVEEARRGGDLPRGISPGEIALGMMAITVGSHCMVTDPQMLALYNIKNPMAVLLQHQDWMLDGWGWKPVSHGDRHLALDRRIHKELFPESTWFKS
jgi:AcrR family transcriptional regulator